MSVGVAALRAMEHGRPDRLFEDPYARRFLEASGGTDKWAAEPPPGGRGFLELMAGQVAVRTRFLDRALLDAAGDGCGQVVLLASGMDARPYRLGWPAGTRLFELDFPEVLRFKRDALSGGGAVPRCAHVEVAADLREDWPGSLRAAGFDPAIPTAWLAEGLLYGLPAEAADLLLADVTRLSAPGSALAADHAEDSPILRAARAAVSAELLGLWRGGPADPDAWLRGRGWAPVVRDIGEVSAEYGRPVPPAFDPALDGTGRGRLITALLR
ncbi:SAM-dependent methyltransferase [Actinomadura viridis]|uniref:SAM-dependent methyltransferase n=1 Tax=Actinomadura viridis TaxID=58110 RepID=UPI0036A298FB